MEFQVNNYKQPLCYELNQQCTDFHNMWEKAIMGLLFQFLKYFMKHIKHNFLSWTTFHQHKRTIFKFLKFNNTFECK